MNWYMTSLTKDGKNVERGWMLASSDMELIEYARIMGYSIDIRYIGEADMKSLIPQILVH